MKNTWTIAPDFNSSIDPRNNPAQHINIEEEIMRELQREIHAEIDADIIRRIAGWNSRDQTWL